MKTCAIIGAGLSGITSASFLNETFDITVYEKSLRPGGRMATRRAEHFYFDHGAQYFTAKTECFKGFVNKMIKDGCVEEWNARFVEIDKGNITNSWRWGEHYPHYVGVPSMNAIAKKLSKGLKVNFGVHVRSVVKKSHLWRLIDIHGKTLGEYDWVITAIPSMQAYDMLPPKTHFLDAISNIKMTPCFSLMLGFDKDLGLDFDAALIRGQDISWISVNNSKPQRSQSFSLLIHSTNNWAEEHISDDKTDITQHLFKQLGELIDLDTKHVSHQALHAWKYANAQKRYGEPYFIDSNQKIAVCGDWLIQGKVESAFISGMKVAEKILEVSKNNN